MGESIEYERPTHPKQHAHDGADGSGTVSHASLTGVTAGQHHAPNLSGTLASRPASAAPATLYLATDTQELFVFV